MKRLIGAAAVLAVGVSIAVASIGGAQTSPGERTLKFVEKGNGSFKFIDNPPKAKSRNSPPSAGDEFLFTNPLYDESGARVGYVTAHCTVEPGVKVPDCQGEAKLKDGSLSLSGLTNESSLKQTISITGGTGAYEGASGSVVSVARSHADNAPSDDTVHLLG